MKRNRKKITFSANEPSVTTVFSGVRGCMLSQVVNGTSQPPKNRVVISADAVTMVEYSAMKMKNASDSGNTFQVKSDVACFAMTSVSVTLPTSSSTATVLMPSAIS